MFAPGKILTGGIRVNPDKWYDHTPGVFPNIWDFHSDGVNMVAPLTVVSSSKVLTRSQDDGETWVKASPTEGLARGLSIVHDGDDRWISGGTLISGGDVFLYRSINGGDAWTTPSISWGGTGATINGVIWDGSQFVAGGHNNGNCRVMSSTNGSTWATETAPGSSISQGLGFFYANGYYFFEATLNGGSTRVWRSTDLSTWTTVGDLGGGPAYSLAEDITYSPELGLWCAVGGTVDGKIHTATDPTGTWTERTNPTTGTVLLTVLAHQGRLFAGGYNNNVVPQSPYLIWSDDGITWQEADDVPTQATSGMHIKRLRAHRGDVYATGVNGGILGSQFLYSTRVI